MMKTVNVKKPYGVVQNSWMDKGPVEIVKSFDSLEKANAYISYLYYKCVADGDFDKKPDGGLMLGYLGAKEAKLMKGKESGAYFIWVIPKDNPQVYDRKKPWKWYEVCLLEN